MLVLTPIGCHAICFCMLWVIPQEHFSENRLNQLLDPYLSCSYGSQFSEVP